MATALEVHQLSCYDLTGFPIGHCVIVNQNVYNNGLGHRKGSERDVEKLEAAFKKLNFEVHVERDLTKQQLYQLANKYAPEVDHSKMRCFAFVIMGHGTEGAVLDKDGQKVKLQTIMKKFWTIHCLGLENKPKFFFVQACRCTKESVSEHDSPPQIPDCRISPDQLDFLLSFSTVKGDLSYRDPENGSEYVKQLCEVLAETAGAEDLLSMLTEVTKRLSGIEIEDEPGRKCFQVAELQSTLSKKVFLGASESPRWRQLQKLMAENQKFQLELDRANLNLESKQRQVKQNEETILSLKEEATGRDLEMKQAANQTQQLQRRLEDTLREQEILAEAMRQRNITCQQLKEQNRQKDGEINRLLSIIQQAKKSYSTMRTAESDFNRLLASAQESPPASPRRLRLLLLGAEGSGRSSLGDALIDKQVFRAGSVTNECRVGESDRVTVIDTPAIDDCKKMLIIIPTVIDKFDTFDSVLLLYRLRWPIDITEIPHDVISQVRSFQVCETLFGTEFHKSVVLVFTHADCVQCDQVKLKEAVEWLRSSFAHMRILLQQVEDRCVMIDSRAECDRQVRQQQVNQLLEKAETTKQLATERLRQKLLKVNAKQNDRVDADLAVGEAANREG